MVQYVRRIVIVVDIAASDLVVCYARFRRGGYMGVCCMRHRFVAVGLGSIVLWGRISRRV